MASAPMMPARNARPGFTVVLLVLGPPLDPIVHVFEAADFALVAPRRRRNFRFQSRRLTNIHVEIPGLARTGRTASGSHPAGRAHHHVRSAALALRPRVAHCISGGGSSRAGWNARPVGGDGADARSARHPALASRPERV